MNIGITTRTVRASFPTFRFPVNAVPLILVRSTIVRLCDESHYALACRLIAKGA